MRQTIPKTMRAIAIRRFGGIETLDLQTLPVPEIGPDEVLIRVGYAGVAVWDALEREGGFAEMFGQKPTFPYVLGTDGAGTIAAAGEDSPFEEGDRVYAASLTNPKGGFYAQYAAVNAENVSHAPDRLSTEQAGVMPSDAMTALRGLDNVLSVKKNESVMIFGASGGVGHLALQFAKRMGARVLAVASGEDGVELARRLGADAALNGRKDDVVDAVRRFAPEGLDAALVTAGGEAAERALTAVRDRGRVAYPSGVNPEPKIRSGVDHDSYDVILDRAAIERLNRFIEAGPFEVCVGRTFALEQAAEAHRALSSHFLGKLALRIE